MYLFIELTDWNYINLVLVEMYRTEDLQTVGKTFLQMLNILIPYQLAHFIVLDKDGKPDLVSSSFSKCTEKDFNEYLETYFEDDYAKILFTYNKTNSYIDRALLDKAKLESSRLYREYMQPRRLTQGCGIIFCDNKNRYGMLNVMRSEELGPITPREYDILNVFAEHIHNILEKKHKTYGNYSGMASQAYNRMVDISKTYFLTNREKEVLTLLLQDYSNIEICEMLNISISTVKTHIYNIFTKMGVKSRAELCKKYRI